MVSAKILLWPFKYRACHQKSKTTDSHNSSRRPLIMRSSPIVPLFNICMVAWLSVYMVTSLPLHKCPHLRADNTAVKASLWLICAPAAGWQSALQSANNQSSPKSTPEAELQLSIPWQPRAVKALCDNLPVENIHICYPPV